MSKKTFLKLGLLCAIVYGLWRVWENDAVVNAFILFCTAGIVPGTGVELTPEQVYIVLGSILFVAIMLIFAKEVRRDIRAVRSAWRNWRQKAIMATGEHRIIEEITAHTVTVTATGPQPQAMEAIMDKPAESKPVVVIVLPRQPGRFAKFWRAARPKLIIALGVTLETIIKAADRAAVLASRGSLQLYRYGMQAWLWMEPHLRQFDKWLERTLKSNKDIAALLHIWSDFLKSANARLVELRARLAARIPRAPEE
ncbi:MAG TPA: hypothetical protein VGO07_02205 [Candidatus Saccharimonadales bacterium]|jgi:hypothetical protein|nr:hypothetical protein [Candidatus Saccharimonadales bacterium]